MSGRNGQVARFYKILSLLEGAPHGLSVTDILERLRGWGVEVTERTVYRDLEGLKEAGFPLEVKGTNTEGANRWTSEKTTRISDYLVLNAREVLALFMARKLLTPLKETPFYEDLETTFAKIEGKLGSKMQSYLEELEGDLHFEPGPRWGLGLDPEVVETCRTALLERQMLEVEYFSVHKQERSTRVLGPHVMYFAKGSLYLLARDMGDQVIKTFAMPRISRAAMLDQAFTEAPIDPAQFFENSFGVFRGKETIASSLSSPNLWLPTCGNVAGTPPSASPSSANAPSAWSWTAQSRPSSFSGFWALGPMCRSWALRSSAIKR